MSENKKQKKTKKAYEFYLNILYGETVMGYVDAQKQFGHLAKTKNVNFWGGIHPLIITYYNSQRLGTFLRKYGSKEFHAGFSDWNHLEHKNIFGEIVQLKNLNLHIEETNKLLGLTMELIQNQNVPERCATEATKAQYYSYKLKELLKLLPVTPFPDWLFVGTYPNCHLYCDKRKEENRDYKEILRLFYNPLRIEITAANAEAYPGVLIIAKERLKHLQMRYNEPLEITVSGQTTSLSLSNGPDVVVK